MAHGKTASAGMWVVDSGHGAKTVKVVAVRKQSGRLGRLVYYRLPRKDGGWVMASEIMDEAAFMAIAVEKKG